MTPQTKTARPAGSQPRHRYTIDEVDRLVAEGVLREGSPAFLWDGEIIEPMAENPDHVNAWNNLRDALLERLRRPAFTINQGNPVELGPAFMPQPDLTVLRGPRSRYSRRRPIPADVFLLVEVGGSTYSLDSGPYLARYAEAGIPRYWIVNLAARRIEVFSNPDPATASYRDRTDYGPGATVPLVLTIDGSTTEFEGIDVEEVLRDSPGEGGG